MKFTSTTTQMSVHAEGDNPVFGETVVTLTMDDEAGGAFFVLGQDDQKIRVELDELREILRCAELMTNQPGVE